MRPTLLLPLLCIGWALLGVACSVGLLPADTWWTMGAALVLVSLVDAWRVRRLAAPDVARDVPDALPVGVQRTVTLALDNGPRTLRVDVHDLHPEAWAIEGLPRTLQLAAESTTRLHYALRPTARGDAVFAGVQLRVHSPWRLWRRSHSVAAAPVPSASGRLLNSIRPRCNEAISFTKLSPSPVLFFLECGRASE